MPADSAVTHGQPEAALPRLSRVSFQHAINVPSDTSWNDATYLDEAKSWDLRVDWSRRVVLIRNLRRGNPLTAVAPFENVASMVLAPDAAELELVKQLAPAMLAVQTVPPPFYKGPEQKEPEPEAPKDLRPAVSMRDLSPTAAAFAQQHGYVLVGGREHRLVP